MATAADLDIKMDATSLYREEIYTDRRIGTIRAMVPVTPKGDADKARETLYIGEAQIMTQMGPLPVTFEIDATSLDTAVSGYAKAAKARRRAHGQRIAGAAAAKRVIAGIAWSGRRQPSVPAGWVALAVSVAAARFRCLDATVPRSRVSGSC